MMEEVIVLLEVFVKCLTKVTMMFMMNYVNILANEIDDVGSFCTSAVPALRIVGWVYVGIQIVVPIILIIVGMLDLAKAVTEKSDDNIKKAQQLLIKRAI